MLAIQNLFNDTKELCARHPIIVSTAIGASIGLAVGVAATVVKAAFHLSDDDLNAAAALKDGPLIGAVGGLYWKLQQLTR